MIESSSILNDHRKIWLTFNVNGMRYYVINTSLTVALSALI